MVQRSFPALTVLFGSAALFALTAGADAHFHGLPVADVVREPLAPLAGAPVEEPPPPLLPENDPRYQYTLPEDIDWLIAPPGLYLRAVLGPDIMPALRPAHRGKAWKPKKRTALADVNRGALRLSVSGIKAGAQNLSEAAHLQLALRELEMEAKFSAAAGHKSTTSEAGQRGPSDLWQRDMAEIAMRMNPMPMTEVEITGAEMLTQTYRQPAQIGESGSAAHMLQNENRAVKLTTFIRPSPALEVRLGASGDARMTRDTTASDRADKSSNLVETHDETVFVSADWTPLPGIEVEGGTTTRASDISWRATNSKSNTYRAAEPHVAVKLHLFDGTEISGRMAYSSSGYNTSSFVSYARNATRTETVPVVPDHAWKIETQVARNIGPARLALHYMEASEGTVTEFGFSGSGVQAPVSTTLVKRHAYGVDLSLPLKSFGAPHTTVSGHAVMRDSRVLDPVTGVYRRASGEVPASLTLKLEHRLPADRLRIGLTDALSAGQTAYQTKEISEIAPTNKLSAYIAYRPGNYELNLNVDGLIGTPSTERYTFVGSRSVMQLPTEEHVPGIGPTVRLSLIRHLN